MRPLTIALTTLFFTGILLYSGCQNDNITPQESILPENFSVDIPPAISGDNNSAMRIAGDTLKGNGIYENLRTFIAVGKGASFIVKELIAAISVYHINKPMSLSFESNDDHRIKNLVVISNAEFESQQWEFQMTVSDSGSVGNDDGGKAVEIFWNRNPVKGIAILKPYNINRGNGWGSDSVLVRIDYSEAGEAGYDKQMIVSISKLPLVPLNLYAIRTLKMFVGKKGDIIDVYGNSNHPNAVFLSGNKGFDWAFVASGLETEDIATAEVGLPSSSLDATSRSVLLVDYSIKNVLTNEIKSVWPDIPQLVLNAYLANADAPGFFSQDGFVAAGTSPGGQYDPIQPRLADLTPYNPQDIKDLSISF